MDYDKTQLPETYAKSRQLSEETVALWMDAVVPDGRPAGGTVSSRWKRFFGE